MFSAHLCDTSNYTGAPLVSLRWVSWDPYQCEEATGGNANFMEGGGGLHTAVCLLSTAQRFSKSCPAPPAPLMLQIGVVSTGVQNQITGLRDGALERQSGIGLSTQAWETRSWTGGPFLALDRKHKSADVEQLADIRNSLGNTHSWNMVYISHRSLACEGGLLCERTMCERACSNHTEQTVSTFIRVVSKRLG